MDGLTTNGVLVMHPAGEFVSEPAPGVWREISVCGNVFALRETRSAQQRGKLVRNSFTLYKSHLCSHSELCFLDFSRVFKHKDAFRVNTHNDAVCHPSLGMRSLEGISIFE